MESRLQATLDLARELVDDIELSRLTPESILLKASRLARLSEDGETEEWLRYELNGYPNTPEARAWMLRFGRLTDPEKNLGFWIPLAGVAGAIAARQAEIGTLQVPNVNYAPTSSNPVDMVGGLATVDKLTAPIYGVLGRIQATADAVSTLSGIKSRVLAAVHDVAVRRYHALTFDSLADTMFEAHRGTIDERLALSAPDVAEKIASVYERLAVGDAEAISQAMNTVRRMIKSVADQVYPPSDTAVVQNGQTYEVGSDKVLNRLTLFLKANCHSESRRQRLSRSIRDINERASAGAHSDVTPAEARALFLATYLTLGEIVECCGDVSDTP